jgi:hypothetical protein
MYISDSFTQWGTSIIFEIEKKAIMGIKLNDGTEVKCKALTKSEYELMVKASTGGLIRQSNDNYDIEAHRLKNNQVLVKEGEYYTLYNNLDDLNKVLENSVPPGNGVEILRNKNQYGSLFPERTEQLVRELCADLKIQYQEPDETLLRKIDVMIGRMDDADSFNEKHFINFLATIGEAIVKNSKARWYMKLASDGVTWNPYLIINGKQIQFFSYLYEDIFLTESNRAGLLVEIYETINDIKDKNLSE